MNYDYYRVFYIVGKTKNITRAARELYTSQPAVTRTIKKLENDLGCQLFYRTKNGMEFTEEGKNLYRYVEDSFHALSKGEDEIANSIALATGTLRIGTTSTSLNGILCEMIEKFSLKYPGVSYEIMTSSNDEIISLLKRGIIDVATLTTPFHPHPDIKTIKSIEIKSILVASPKYADLKNKEITPQMLEKYPFITLSRNMQLREYIEETFASLNMHIKPKIEIDVATLIIPLLEAGLGLSILPRILVEEEIKQGKLIELKPGFDIPDRTINIVYSESYLQTRVTRAFIKEISE